jgi:hypothetical protein
LLRGGRRKNVTVGALHDGDLYAVLDGGRNGGEGRPLFYFTGRINKVIRSFTVYKTMASATSRMQRVRPGFGTVRLTENLHIITKAVPRLGPVDFCHYPELSSGGNVIGPVRLARPDEMWSLPWPVKRLVLEDYIMVSGDWPELDEDPDEAGQLARDRAANTSEPVFMHALPQEFFEDLYKMTHAVAVIDLTAGDGAAAVSAVRQRLAYFGLCLNEGHKQQLTARVKHQLLNAMATEGDHFYEPALVTALLQETGTPELPSGPGAGQGRQRQGGRGGRGNSKCKGRALRTGFVGRGR